MYKLSIRLKLVLIINLFFIAVSQSQTIKFKESQIEYYSYEARIEMANASGAPFSPIKTIVIDDVNVANDLENYVGRLIRISKDSQGNESIDFLMKIIYDIDTVTLITPSRPTTDFKHISKERIGELSFWGITGGLENKDLYEYKSTTAVIGRILDKQIDKNKIPEYAKCQGQTTCEYYYLNSAAVQTCSIMMLRTKSRNIKIKNIPVPAALVSLNGEYYSGDRNEERNTRNYVFCSLLRVSL
ncbi:hypothetical protein [Flavihumibacter sp. UBA7668]|uniref:hypothetical protein n=1 Tax=Flavihumibacter sp. UBA7668 TaxID=1946542 RepID=UPI0025C0DFC5|nr:hypothetical protein [Flavihumibacter sp. UBA7668]